MSLDREQIDKVRLTMLSAGWNDVMKPALEQRVRQKIKSLILFPAERNGKDQDDSALRAAIKELEWMLVSWQNEIAASDHNQRVDELDRDPELSPANP